MPEVRRDRDQMLFRALGAPFPLYVVHLTWREETDPTWPYAHPYRTLADFCAEEEA